MGDKHAHVLSTRRPYLTAASTWHGLYLLCRAMSDQEGRWALHWGGTDYVELHTPVRATKGSSVVSACQAHGGLQHMHTHT